MMAFTNVHHMSNLSHRLPNRASRATQFYSHKFYTTLAQSAKQTDRNDMCTHTHTHLDT